MVLYPLLTAFLELDNRTSGIFIGGTVHDVAQVIGTGYTISDEAGHFATITKLFRVAMLVPVVLVLSAIFRSKNKRSSPEPLPIFIIGFCVLVAINRSEMIPEGIQMFLIDTSRWCLITTIAALGIKNISQTYDDSSFSACSPNFFGNIIHWHMDTWRPLCIKIKMLAVKVLVIKICGNTMGGSLLATLFVFGRV